MIKHLSGKDLARGLAVMVLFSALFALRFNWSIVSDLSTYQDMAGLLNSLSTLPFWIVIIGATLLALDKPVGFWTLCVGTVFAVLGNTFGYVPFVPWFRWNPLIGLVVVHVANFLVVALIGYFYFKRPEQLAA